MNTEERQLADVLHRITPEPQRPVTVEQVAYRLVSEPRLGRQTRGREPRVPGRGVARYSAAPWRPVLAAAAVVVIAGASAGIAVLASSHHHPPAPSAGAPASSASLVGLGVLLAVPDVILDPADHAGARASPADPGAPS